MEAINPRNVDTEAPNTLNPDDSKIPLDYSKRAQWLRAAVLGAIDGLLSTASLMMGIGAVRQDSKIMILTGIAGLIAGACSMAIGEFVSVSSQYDTEKAQIKREEQSIHKEVDKEDEELPNPMQASAASALSFAIGAMVPILAAAFVRSYHVRLGIVAAAATVALLGFGWIAAVLGNAPKVKSMLRVLVGGWMSMAITFGITKAIGGTSI